MSLLETLIGLSNGLGGAFAILWAWFGTRVALYSWRITEADPQVRARAWIWWRAGIMILAITMAIPYNLENILRAKELITPLESFAMLNIAHLMHCAALCCYSTGLDVSLGNGRQSLPVYVAIPLMFGVGGIVLQ